MACHVHPAEPCFTLLAFSDADFAKPQIGVASTWSMVTPCNMHINTLADHTASGIDQAGEWKSCYL